MEQWKKLAQPPAWALKKIEAGRLKGKSDINPQWRYYAMTETFGMVGIGWKYTIDKMWTEVGANSETLAFVQVSVYVRNTDDGTWSDAIPGIGGSTLIAKESKGLYNNDEAYKMAVTDALSTALKMLGVAADIYMGMWDGAKYKQTQPETTKEENKPTPSAVKSPIMNLEDALKVKDSHGILYGDKPDVDLERVTNSQEAPAQKKEAAKLILESRKVKS